MSFEYNYKISVDDKYEGLFELGESRATFDRYGSVKRLYLPVTSQKLNLFKEISGTDAYTINQKLNELLASWQKKLDTQLQRESNAEGKELAEQLSIESEQKIHAYRTILAHTLGVDDQVDWESIKSHEEFEIKEFEVAKPTPKTIPGMGTFSRPKFSPPSVSFLAKIFGRKSSILRKYQQEYDSDIKHFEQKMEQERSRFESKKSEIEKENEETLASWENEKNSWYDEQKRLKSIFDDEQETHNLKIDELKRGWSEGRQDSVIEHACLVLDNSVYPDSLNPNYRVQYDDSSKLMKVEYDLPNIDIVKIPKSVRFIQSTGELKETLISASDQKALYDEMMKFVTRLQSGLCMNFTRLILLETSTISFSMVW